MRALVAIAVLALAPDAARAQDRARDATRPEDAEVALAWVSTPRELDRAIRDPELGSVVSQDLVISGAVTLAIGYVGGLLFAALDEAWVGCWGPSGYGRSGCSTWPWAFVPIGGAIAAGVVEPEGRHRDSVWIGVTAGAAMALVQTIGLAVLFGSLARPQEDVVVGRPAIRAGPWGDRDGGGLWLDARF